MGSNTSAPSVDADVYRAVLDRPEGTQADQLPGPARSVRAGLNRLVAAGLVRRTGERFFAVPPQEALGLVFAEESRRLDQTSGRLRSLQALLPALAGQPPPGRQPARQPGEPLPAEVVAGGQVAALLRVEVADSPGDLLWLLPDREDPPFDCRAASPSRPRALGGSCRAILPARILEHAPEVVRDRAAAGEQVRVLASVPTWLVVAGAGVALLPQRWEVPGDRALVVREHSLVMALRALFEALWDRAVAVPGVGSSFRDDGYGARRLLLEQLAAGAKDEQIARRLGLSLRTVRRRVADLLDVLGADSRFQAGMEAVRRGWL